MSGERGESSRFIDKWEKLNWVAMGFSLLIVGGAVGVALALVDAAQIAGIKWYKGKKQKG